MRRLVSTGLAGFLLLAVTAPASPLGDMALHGLAGASCALIVSAALSPLLLADAGPQEALQRSLAVSGSGLGAALLAGVVKELLDLGGFGRPEWLDLAATLAGGLVASAGVFAVTYLVAGQGADGRQLAPVYASFGVVLCIPVGEALVRRLFGRRSSASSG
jgi:hypothetical protein